MDWFIAALIGAFSMALAWTFLKKAREKGLPNAYSLVIYYIILVVSLSSWQLVNKVSFPIPSFAMIIFIFLVSCIPIVSNLLVLYSFERSANPGLTLSLVATSSLWLFFGGLIFFGSKFSILAITGVILIFLGVAYLNYQHQKADFHWILYGLIGKKSPQLCCDWVKAK